MRRRVIPTLLLAAFASGPLVSAAPAAAQSASGAGIDPAVSYRQSPAGSATACAATCGQDRACGSWTWRPGQSVRGSSRARPQATEGLCVLSQSRTPPRLDGAWRTVSGLPAAAVRSSQAAYLSGGSATGPAATPVQSGGGYWEVRPLGQRASGPASSGGPVSLTGELSQAGPVRQGQVPAASVTAPVAPPVSAPQRTQTGGIAYVPPPAAVQPARPAPQMAAAAPAVSQPQPRQPQVPQIRAQQPPVPVRTVSQSVPMPATSASGPQSTVSVPLPARPATPVAGAGRSAAPMAPVAPVAPVAPAAPVQPAAMADMEQFRGPDGMVDAAAWRRARSASSEYSVAQSARAEASGQSIPNSGVIAGSVPIESSDWGRLEQQASPSSAGQPTAGDTAAGDTGQPRRAGWWPFGRRNQPAAPAGGEVQSEPEPQYEPGSPEEMQAAYLREAAAARGQESGQAQAAGRGMVTRSSRGPLRAPRRAPAAQESQ
jgi:hypothetical protein